MITINLYYNKNYVKGKYLDIDKKYKFIFYLFFDHVD